MDRALGRSVFLNVKAGGFTSAVSVPRFLSPPSSDLLRRTRSRNGFGSATAPPSLQLLHTFQIHAGRDASADGVKWWQKGDGPNLRDIHSTQEFLDALSNAGEKLVVVEFFATWCGSCRALYPKLCQLASDHPEVEFIKVDFDVNKPMCKSLNVKFLPYFHFYRGAEGKLDAFSCSLSKLAKLKEAIERHNTDRCSLGPPLGLGEDAKLLGISSSGTAV